MSAKIKVVIARMEQIERVFLQLMNVIDSTQMERAITVGMPAVFAGETTPAFLASAIVPAAGSTIVDFPVIASAPAVPQPQRKVPFAIIEGFNVSRDGDKVIVSGGKYIKDGEEKTFAGAEVITKPNSLVVFNIQEEKVEVVQDRLPIHHVLEVVL